MGTFFGKDLNDAHLFQDLRTQFEHNTFVASGVDPGSTNTSNVSLTLPTEAKGKTASDLASIYLAATPFEEFFNCTVEINIPDQSRFEHCHIIGGTGHGKTQCLQYLITQDLLRAVDDNISLVVIDSQGDLIRKLSASSLFTPNVEGLLSDRFVLIDPSDIENPPALNLFDPGLGRMEDYSPREREMAFNSLVDIYGRFFGALLGAELTSRQSAVFRYLARLMLTIEGATIHTLIDLMDNVSPFKSHIAQLDPTARRFFEKEFSSGSFRSTRQQIKQRLYTVLSIPTFDRLFSAPKSRIDFFEELNSGKIILINTAKDLLKQDGTEIFGRFILALLEHAIMERAVLPEAQRNPVFLYIDEAQDYFDETIETLLVQARKYHCGITLAHQTLAQLTPRLRATVASNTTVKLAGGISDSDARALAPDMRTTADFLMSMRKRQSETEFALSVRNITTAALQIKVPFGYLEGGPTLTADEQLILLEGNRLRIGYTPKIEVAEEVIPMPPPEAAETILPDPSDQTHRDIQQMLKQAANGIGLFAAIEQPVLNGKGRVDLVIETGRKRIACEISVTTRPEHELQNIEKCLSAGFDEVWMIAQTDEALTAISTELENNVPEMLCSSVQFLSPAEAAARVNSLAPPIKTSTGRVLGYDVVVASVPVDPQKADLLRHRILAVSEHLPSDPNPELK